VAFSHERFTWEKGKGSAEIGDLGPSPFIRVYPDACDEGFDVIGRTGRTVRFVVVETTRDGEGEVQSWRLEPAARELRGYASITLFND
jgi:hypothetical protein